MLPLFYLEQIPQGNLLEIKVLQPLAWFGADYAAYLLTLTHPWPPALIFDPRWLLSGAQAMWGGESTYSGVKTKKEASSKDTVECLRGAQLLSVLLDIWGSYNMKSSIWLWSHMSRRGMSLAKSFKIWCPLTFKKSIWCKEWTSVILLMGHNP